MDHERTIMMCLVLAVVCSPVLGKEWTASVEKTLEALVGSCVVLPCSFTHPGGILPTSRLRGIWHLKENQNDIIYHEDSTKIKDSYKDRTKFLGNLGQNNCTLEITTVKDFDNGPFCFRIELVRKDNNQPTAEKFSFVEQCSEIKMMNKPELSLGHLKTAIQGKPYTVTCSVRHTCSSHWPQISWSRKSKDDEIREVHKFLYSGIWETESILTFIPEEKDDDTELTCTATFHGKQTFETKFTLNIKRTKNNNHIIIPTVAVVVTAVIFGLFCVLMVKKYKKRIQELQTQDGSIWNRMSRLSRRLHSGDSRPVRSDQRRSIWSRFSRRPQRNEFDQSPNNANSCGGQKASKPRFPSPKSQPKSCNYKQDLDDNDDYMNTADLNIYGNM